MNTDPRGLEDSVKPNIEDAQSFFDKAYEKIFTVNVPSDIDCDFRREMKLKLEELLFDVKDLTDEIDKYISDLKEVNAGTRKTVENLTFGEFLSDNFGKMDLGMMFSDIPGTFNNLMYNWTPQRQEATRDLMTDAALGVGNTLADDAKKTCATIANSFVALLSGAGKALENIFDSVMTAQAYETYADTQVSRSNYFII